MSNKEENMLLQIPVSEMQKPGFVGSGNVSKILGENFELFFLATYSDQVGQRLIVRLVKNRKNKQGKPAEKCLDTSCIGDSWEQYFAAEAKKEYKDKKPAKKSKKK